MDPCGSPQEIGADEEVCNPNRNCSVLWVRDKLLQSQTHNES